MYRSIQLLEDARPYYIRFKIRQDLWNSIEAICQEELNSAYYIKKFTSHELTQEHIKQMIALTSDLFLKLELRRKRVNLFVSNPGYYGIPHKDSADMKFGINFVLEAKDDLCVTNWYTDEAMSKYQLINGETYNGYGGLRHTREVRGFEPGSETPAKSMIAVEGECVLFNVDMYHDWFNNSPNRRTVLTMRPVDGSSVTFDDAVKYLFRELDI